MIVGGIRGVVARDGAEVLEPSDSQPASYPLRAAISLAPRDAVAAGVQTEGDTVTQTITLHAGWNAIFAKFEELNPDVKLIISTSGGAMDEQKLMCAVAGGSDARGSALKCPAGFK